MTQTTETSVAEPVEPIRNPFQVPHLAGTSLRPLSPWRYPGHGDYYADVDNTEASFRAFKDYLPDPPGDLEYSGRLVVVAGPTGCGKTSLIHRCVAELRRRSTTGTWKVVDLSGIAPAMPMAQDPPGETSRVEDYLTKLADQVRNALAGEDENFRDPEPAAMWPAHTAYTRISSRLRQHDNLLAVILPRFKDAVTAPAVSAAGTGYHPVQHYMEFRHARIVFFAESLDPDGVARWHDRISSDADREDALLLRVGPLELSDGWTFALDRIGRSAHAVPEVAKETMLEVVRNHHPMSLSLLQKLCHWVWQDVMQRPGISVVTPADFERYYTGQTDGFKARSPLPRNGQP